MWVIISFVTMVALFGPKPHEFSSNKHFPTEEECKAAMPDDAEELLGEISGIPGADGPVHLESHCAIDTYGEPA